MRDRQAETAQLLRQASLVASTGGTYLVDPYRWEDQLDEYEIVLRAGKPLVFLSQSLGPFKRSSTGYERLRRVLNHASLVMLRDRPSLESLERLGVKSRTVLAPDMAFLLVPETPFEMPAAIECSSKGTSRPQIAVSVREWKHATPASPVPAQQQYATRMPKLLERLVDELDADIVMVSTCQGVHGYYDDSAFAGELSERTRRSVQRRIKVDRTARSPAEFMDFATSFDLAICTRMHAGILSWIAGTPVVGIAYEQKQVEIFEANGVPDLVHDYSEIPVNLLVEQARQILDGRRETGAEIRERVVDRATELKSFAQDLSGIFAGAQSCE